MLKGIRYMKHLVYIGKQLVNINITELSAAEIAITNYLAGQDILKLEKAGEDLVYVLTPFANSIFGISVYTKG